jgi:glutathione S-transferase
MALHLYYHPLSSFCQKALMALYENATPFQPHFVEFTPSPSREEFLKLWPVGKFPVLRDDARDWMVPESSIIIEYLDQHFPGKVKFIPSDPDLARQVRMRDRFFDLYVASPMQKVLMDRRRPASKNDPFGVEQAKAQLETAYRLIDQDMENKTWAMGDTFTMADCAAAPALFFANLAVPFAGTYKNMKAYSERLLARPSFARACKEGQPYLAMVPNKSA